MKLIVSEKKLHDVLDFDDLRNLFRHFAKLTGIDVSLHDVEGLETRIRKEFGSKIVDTDSPDLRDSLKKTKWGKVTTLLIQLTEPLTKEEDEK